MASSSTFRLALRLLVLLAAGAGAQAAFFAGYWASLAICLGFGVWAVAGIARDVLERRGERDEAVSDLTSALMSREREARTLTAFLDHAPVPLLALRSGGPLTALNLSARRAFRTDDVVITPPAGLVPAILGAQPGVRRSLGLDFTGTLRTYALTVAELASDGDLVRIAALTDIQAEVQAAEASALRELMQVLSHEIMNSLTPVTSLAQGAAELLAGSPGPEDLAQAKAAADIMARRSEGLVRFVEAYRELARLPEPAPAMTDVSALIADLARLFASRWSVPLDLSVPDGVVAMLDRDLVTQALLNVLANAAEAALEASETPRVSLTVHTPAPGGLEIEICDNGPGIDLPDPSIIFRPFYSTKARGTGVGLSLVRQVVLGHGGEVEVRPADGGGACVTLRL